MLSLFTGGYNSRSGAAAVAIAVVHVFAASISAIATIIVRVLFLMMSSVFSMPWLSMTLLLF